MARMVFTSFGGLVPLIHEGKVTQEDLDQAFYYLGCAASLVGDLTAEEYQRVVASEEEQSRIRDMLNQGLARANTNGRLIGWGEGGRDTRTYKTLNKHLVREGYDPILVPLNQTKYFAPPLVVQLAKMQNHELTFVFDSLD